MSSAALALHQFRYDQKVFWRNPAAVFFTVMFPVMLLILLAAIFGNQTIDSRHGISTAAYYVPAITTLAVIAATLVGIAFRMTELRESGVLKRVRGTPVPAWVVIAGRAGNSIVVALLMVILVGVIGRIFYGVDFPTATIPALLLTLFVGASAFSCLGFALSAAIPSEDAAPAITNAVALPLYFISGVLIPDSEIPNGILNIADIFPVRHFFDAMFAAYDPATTGSGLQLGDLAIVAAWGLAGLVIAIFFFRWEPRGQ